MSKETVYVYVQAPNGQPLMPTTRYRKVRHALRDGKAKVVSRLPFTIRLMYEPKTRIVQPISLGIDPGRTNIGIAAVKSDGTCVYRAHVTTRNKQIPKLMEKRHRHRDTSRRGERLRRKRRAKENGTTMINSSVDRILPWCDKSFIVKDIINTEARFSNRNIPNGWFTPTATQLIRTHINTVKLIKRILPLSDVCLEINKFAFMELDNPGIKRKNINFNNGALRGFNSRNDAIYTIQNGMCILCRKNPIEHYHHVLQRSKNGSNTIENVVGLCHKCHENVHKYDTSKRKLDNIHKSRSKKYSAISVLNSIIPALATELSKMFKDHTYVTFGYYTKETRDRLKLSKEHNIDAYCISLQCFNCNNFINSSCISTKIYEIAQFRRQNRAKIHHQNERTYKLNKIVVAKNRRKRNDQLTDSLHEWYMKTKSLYGKCEAKRIQSDLVVFKCKRSYNDMNRVLPGAIFEFDKKLYVLSGRKDNGKHFMAYNFGNKLFPSCRCKIVAHNKGLVYVS